MAVRQPRRDPRERLYGRTADRAAFDIVKKYAENAVLPGKDHPHRLRHGLATEFIRVGDVVDRLYGDDDSRSCPARPPDGAPVPSRDEYASGRASAAAGAADEPAPRRLRTSRSSTERVHAGC